MALKDILKISRKTFFNPSGWLGYNELKSNTQSVWSIVKGLFVKAEPTRTETFEQAMVRLKLTEVDVANRTTLYKRFALFFLVCALLVFGYAWYLVFSKGSITGFMLAFAASALFSGQAFQYDFWAFQMRRRKLGATVNEWKQQYLGQ
jgi:intracellular multiplication protein IcmV